ncbi:fractalkine isoform X1 [Arvicanthis niloticus]|uniref:fractalkine isoform X1 n=1 Tax=Arvicanthis niloticus TaxID=61156 RepID=UPI001486A432|nr:fractalkine [Arvicanthis niloticus]
MAPSPLAWLLHLAAFFHLSPLLAGQHLGMTKCNITCNKMTSQIPVTLLIHYQPNQESCGKRAIVLETKQHRHFCADPKEKWVQDAMKHLDHQAAALTKNGGKFEKRVDNVTPGITSATRGLSPSALAKPESATVEDLTLEPTTISQEARRTMGTSQEPPAAVTGSSSSTSEAQDAGLTTKPQSTGSFEVAADSTATWQSSAVYQSGSSLWAEVKATETPSATALSPQVSTTSHSTPEENVGSEGQPPWVQEQDPSPEKSLGSEEINPVHTDIFQDRGPGNTIHPSVAPISSEETPSPELVASGSQAPKVEEAIHVTADPQKLSVLITPVPDTQAATRRQAVGLLAFLGLLFCLGVAMFAYQSLQGCPRKMAGEMVEGLRYVPRSCGSNSYVLVPV